MTTIRRHDPNAVEEVEVPEGYVVCPACEGEGYRSKYDMGARSLMHSPELAAKRACMLCGGKGYWFDFESRMRMLEDA